MVTARTALKGDTKGIVERLTTLTDLVRIHEDRMSEMEDGITAHQIRCPLADRVTAIELKMATALASASALAKTEAKWEKRLEPILKTLGLIFLGIILTHSAELLKMLAK